MGIVQTSQFVDKIRNFDGLGAVFPQFCPNKRESWQEEQTCCPFPRRWKNVALSCTAFRYLTLNNNRDLEISVRGLLFSTGQTAVKLSGAEAADRAQCAAPD